LEITLPGEVAFFGNNSGYPHKATRIIAGMGTLVGLFRQLKLTVKAKAAVKKKKFYPAILPENVTIKLDGDQIPDAY